MADDGRTDGGRGASLLSQRKESALIKRLSLGLGAIITVIAVTWSNSAFPIQGLVAPAGSSAPPGADDSKRSDSVSLRLARDRLPCST